MVFSLVISLLGLLFLLINAILFFTTFKNRNLLYKIITIYLILLFIVESCCNYIGFLYPNNNLFLSHYYFIFQFLFLSLFFYNLFKNPILKNLVVVFLVLETVALIQQYLKTPAIYWKFNLFEIASTSVLLLLYAVIYLIINFKITKHPYFFFCSGLIIYLSSSAIIFLSGNTDLVLFTKPIYFDVWIFNSLFYLVYQYLIYREWKELNRKSEEESN